jgi:hypothetical protein
MGRFDSYKDAFPHARLTRSPNGVLEVVLHTDGGTLIFNGHTHEAFVELFHQIGQVRDPSNRATIAIAARPLLRGPTRHGCPSTTAGRGARPGLHPPARTERHRTSAGSP